MNKKTAKERPSLVSRAIQFCTQKLVDGVQTNDYACNICSKSLKGSNKSNLVSHFKQVHKDVYNKNILVEDEDSIHIHRTKTIYSLVELVSINSLPFAALSSSGFRTALESQLRSFQLAGCAINLNDHHVYEVKQKVNEVAQQIRNRIKDEVNGKIVSVMLDSATRLGRSIFGIALQYKINGILKEVTIAMRELKKSHTAAYLTDVLKAVLTEYDIDLHQVLSVTTDNGSNMLAMVNEIEDRLFAGDEYDDENDEGVRANVPYAQKSKNSNPTNATDQLQLGEKIQRFLQRTESARFDEDEALDSLLDDSRAYGDLLERLVQDTRQRNGNDHIFITSIRCAAHTLQLSIKDAMKLFSDDDKNVISLCREAAKFMRRPSTRYEMRQNGLKSILPALDVKTRWNSTYKMVSKWFKMKNISFI